MAGTFPTTRSHSSTPGPLGGSTTLDSAVEAGMNENAGLLVQWKKTSRPSVAICFVLDYHLLPGSEENKPPPGLKWPREDGSSLVSGADVYNFHYRVLATTNTDELLSPMSLQQRAASLSQELISLVSRHDEKVPVILVGYGYGGLICEQAALLLRQQKVNMCGIVLMGTPHFRAGLAQWASLSADRSKQRNPNAGDTPQTQDRSRYAEDITAVVKKQDKFCETFRDGRARVNVACCFAQREETSKGTCQFISPEWCILSGFKVAAISASYSQMTGFASDVEYADVDRLVETWIQDKAELKIPDSDSMSIRSVKSNSPSLRRVSWMYPEGEISADITVGAIVKSREDMEILATATEIEKSAKVRKSLVRYNRDLNRDLVQRSSVPSRRDPYGTTEPQSVEELNPDCAAKYANGAVRLDIVKDYLSKGKTAFLVVGTSTRLNDSGVGNNDCTLGTRPPASAPTSPTMGTLSSSFQQGQVMGLQLRPVRAVSSQTLLLRTGSTRSPTSRAGLSTR